MMVPPRMTMSCMAAAPWVRFRDPLLGGSEF
jgi:hypothetical protein